jgi:hypothetical protein
VGFNTAQVNNLIKGKATERGSDVTWNWHHLDHALEEVFGKVASDARVLIQWLAERQHKQGLLSEYTTDAEGYLERVFVGEGAKDHWARGNHVVFYDTTLRPSKVI